MPMRDCDLEELLNFQEKSIEICQNLSDEGHHLQILADEAEGLLKDDVSKRSIEKVRELAEFLVAAGEHGRGDMELKKRKTQQDLDSWNTMRR